MNSFFERPILNSPYRIDDATERQVKEWRREKKEALIRGDFAALPALSRRAAHRPSACSGVKALRNTSCARRTSRQAPLAFRSLDPLCVLREPDRRRRDEERPSSSEQRTG
jgi:hypothetical protein